MITATDTITVQLYQSVNGLAVEVSGLPVVHPQEWINRPRVYEMALERVRSEFPELKILGSCAVNSDGYVFYVERL